MSIHVSKDTYVVLLSYEIGDMKLKVEVNQSFEIVQRLTKLDPVKGITALFAQPAALLLARCYSFAFPVG